MEGAEYLYSTLQPTSLGYLFLCHCCFGRPLFIACPKFWTTPGFISKIFLRQSVCWHKCGCWYFLFGWIFLFLLFQNVFVPRWHWNIQIFYAAPFYTLEFYFFIAHHGSSCDSRKKTPIILFFLAVVFDQPQPRIRIIPLELVHEHRNYFAMVGFCVAIAFGVTKN